MTHEALQSLRNAIRAHNYNYYVRGTPTITDAEYDQLWEQLVELERAHPEWITPESPTQQAAANALARSTFAEVEHEIQMYSLDNAFTEAEAAKYLERIGMPVWIEPKIDGLAISLTYQDGLLIAAVTRGTGLVGEDVTANARRVQGIPTYLNPNLTPKSLIVHGEIYMPKAVFEEQFAREFANPRNAAVGSLRQSDPDVTEQRQLAFAAYNAFAPEWAECCHAELMENLVDIGFPTPTGQLLYHTADVTKLYEYALANRDQAPFEIDGIVVKANAAPVKAALGYTQRAPRWAFAYKFPAKASTTTVTAVEFSVSRSGIITPVAHLEPVSINGVTISAATLYNMSRVEELDIRVGDKVAVQRAGDVIPEITGVLQHAPNSTPTVIPPSCPACHAPVVPTGAKGEYKCANPFTCPAQLKGTLKHFASRNGMNIQGLGESIIDTLVACGLVRDVAGLYELTFPLVWRLPRLGDVLGTKLIEAIAASKTPTLSAFIYALSIPDIGKGAAAELAKRFDTFEALRTVTPVQLTHVPGLGQERIHSILAFFRDSRNLAVLDRLYTLGVRPISPKATNPSKPLTGTVWVFTGKLDTLTRTAAHKLVQTAGGHAADVITRSTTHVVAGTGAGAKLAHAQTLGLKILSEAEFLSMLENTK